MFRLCVSVWYSNSAFDYTRRCALTRPIHRHQECRKIPTDALSRTVSLSARETAPPALFHAHLLSRPSRRASSAVRSSAAQSSASSPSRCPATVDPDRASSRSSTPRNSQRSLDRDTSPSLPSTPRALPATVDRAFSLLSRPSIARAYVSPSAPLPPANRFSPDRSRFIPPTGSAIFRPYSGRFRPVPAVFRPPGRTGAICFP